MTLNKALSIVYRPLNLRHVQNLIETGLHALLFNPCKSLVDRLQALDLLSAMNDQLGDKENFTNLYCVMSFALHKLITQHL